MLTACGIETNSGEILYLLLRKLQQCLPLAVLKHEPLHTLITLNIHRCNSAYRLRYWNEFWRDFVFAIKKVATVLTACGIETSSPWYSGSGMTSVATVLTACGIETFGMSRCCSNHMAVATVLTACGIETHIPIHQQDCRQSVATVLTACGIETRLLAHFELLVLMRCNSAYRLRYATKGARQQRSKATMRPAHL